MSARTFYRGSSVALLGNNSGERPIVHRFSAHAFPFGVGARDFESCERWFEAPEPEYTRFCGACPAKRPE